MTVRWAVAANLAALFCVAPAMAQTPNEIPAREAPSAFAGSAAPDILEISFTGLRRISSQAVRAQMRLRAGEKFEERRVAEEVRTLAQLGWFRDVSVEARSEDENGARGLRLIFHLEEQPFLTGVEFKGSRALSAQQIEKILQYKGLALHTGAPENNAAEHRAAQAIREALEQLGHPQSRVQIQRQELANATTRVRFAISDGPRVTFGKIAFRGEPALPEKTLLKQMREIKSDSLLSGLQGKNVFTNEGYEKDRQNLLEYYQNHGFPEARIGVATRTGYQDKRRRWLPWPHHVTGKLETVEIPIEAGRRYEFGKMEVDEALQSAVPAAKKAPAESAEISRGKPYSAQAVEQWRRAWFALLNPRGRNTASEFRGVDATRTFDAASGGVHVRLERSEAPPILVTRVEFRGLHRFKDRFIRRRIVLEEGKPLDERALEAGLTRIARTGYFRPVKKEDVQVAVNERERTANVTIHFKEIGQQRVSFSGGRSAFGNTLGLAYSVFDLLNREELISAQMEGGPQSAFLILGLAKQGFLAQRGTLAISLFDTILRPRFITSVKGPFFTSRNEGVNAGWNYEVSDFDAIGVNCTVTRTVAKYSLALPSGLTGVIPSDLRSKTDSRSLGTNWTHDSGNERIVLSDSVSGGVLGGNENLLRGSGEYGRIFRDPFVSARNAWAFRTTVRAAGSYSGDMPLYQRMFSGDELVRGLRAGELGPYAITSRTDSAGNTTYSATPAGANLVSAANAEYRVPLQKGFEAAGFFDLGAGWLLPNWVGKVRPNLFSSTNGLLHGSTGIEMRWTVPGVQIPVRGYYSVSLLRLNRRLALPDKTFFHARNRLSAFGWALGTLF